MANLTYTVANKNGSYDGDTVVKQYNSVTINTGDTVTVDQPCRGLVIYCKGNMTVNGTLSMSLRGAATNPSDAGGSDNNSVSSNGIKFGFFDGSSSDSLTIANTLYNGMGTSARTILANASSGSGTNYKVHTIPRTSNSGGNEPSVSSNGDRETPASIRGAEGSLNTHHFGGGGAGGQAYNTDYGRGGAGGDSTCFSGGSGGGGAAGGGSGNAGHRGSAANNLGGQGGTGGNHNESSSRPCGTGGAGNPKGPDGSVGVGGQNDAENGTGGLIVLIVGGNLTIGTNGKIQANGGRGSDNSYSGDNSSQGGGSGGGHILIMCKGTVTADSSTIAAGQYVGNAGSSVGSADSYGVQDYNIQAWGGRGGASDNSVTQNLYTGTTTTRNGGAGGRGLISIYDLS